MTKAQKIVALRQRGASYKEIAASVGCDLGYVSAALQRSRRGGYRDCDLRDYERRHGRKLRPRK